MIPGGWGAGSPLKFIGAMDKMLETVDREPYRIISMHDTNLPGKFPSRRTAAGNAVTQIRLAKGAPSYV